MTVLNRAVRFFSNKYLVVTAVFLLFLLFLDPRNLFNQYSRYREMKALERTCRQLTEANRQLRKDDEELRSNPVEIERIAREKYYFKRDNETVFLFPEQQNVEKK